MYAIQLLLAYFMYRLLNDRLNYRQFYVPYSATHKSTALLPTHCIYVLIILKANEISTSTEQRLTLK
jgi:hypothetical protein